MLKLLPSFDEGLYKNYFVLLQIFNHLHIIIAKPETIGGSSYLLSQEKVCC